MRPPIIISCVGAILSARILPVHGKPVEIFQRDGKADLPRGVTLCNDIHGCRGSYLESSKHRDLSLLVWARASGEGAAGEGAAREGAAGEGAEGEGAKGQGAQGEGAQGQGAQGQGSQGEGAQGGSSSNQPSEGSDVSPSGPPSEIPPSEPSDYLAGSDGSLPDRPSSEIGDGDSLNGKSPENQEILPLSEYAAKGQRYYDLMMKAAHIQPKQEPIYASFNERYRLRSDKRSPIAPNKDYPSDNMDAVLYLKSIASPPEIGIDLKAEDWTYRMLTAKGWPMPENFDTEDDATIVTYISQSQRTILVTKSDSATNDIPDPANPNTAKLPNSELMFQLLKQQAGDAVSDIRFIIQHAIDQKGTLAVLEDAHKLKGLAPTDMGTWTSTDGAVFWRLLGTRNGRPSIFMLTDHPTDMKCKVVTKVFTWAQMPDDMIRHGAMIIEMGPVASC